MTVALKSSLNTFIRILLLVSSEYVSASKGTKTLCFYKKYPRWMLYASAGGICLPHPARGGLVSAGGLLYG
ncbi:Uncharacterised protein [Mycobacterium tuberculosis]|nr:Uncharacterised protein [Mycobacterium tuberculosis]